MDNDNINESLTLGHFIINRPPDWDLNCIKLEINDYDSTNIDISDLKLLHYYISSILEPINLNFYENKRCVKYTKGNPP